MNENTNLIDEHNENLIPVKILSPFKRMVLSIGTLPSAFYDTMTYYEALVWFYEYMKNTVIPTINNNGEAVEELQQAFITLETFISEYFDNLDVQQEINNKLDDMAEDGSLEELIDSVIVTEPYLTKVYNTYTDLIADTENLVDGMKVKTLGYYSINDGGSASYYITDDETEPYEYYIELSNNLKLVLINEEYNVYKVDCLGLIKSSDDTVDTSATTNTTILQGLIDFLEENNVNGIIKFSNGLYKLNPITLNYAARLVGELDNNDVAIEDSDFVGTTLLDMSDTSSAFITIEPTESRLWGVIIANMKIAGLYKKHDGLVLRKAGHVSRLSNVTIMRFLGHGLYLDNNYDSYISNVNIIECGYEDSETLKYALNITSSLAGYTTSNALHFIGTHLEHCRYAINIDYDTQIFFNSLKVESGSYYNGSYIESTEPMVKITANAYQVNFNNCTFNGKSASTDSYYMMRISAISAFNNKTRTLTNCNFTTGSNDGGKYLYVENSNTTLTGCSFTNMTPLSESFVIDGATNIITNSSFNMINIGTSTSPYVIYIKNKAVVDNCSVNSLNSSGAEVYAINTTSGNSIGKITGLNGISHFMNVNANTEVQNYDSLGITSSNITNYGSFDSNDFFTFDFSKWVKPYHSILVTSLSADLKIKEFKNFPLNYPIVFVNNQNAHSITVVQYSALYLPTGTSTFALTATGSFFKYIKSQTYGFITEYNNLN